MKYKFIYQLKRSWFKRKAFLRFILLSRIVCNIGRMYAALQCWKSYVKNKSRHATDAIYETNDFLMYRKCASDYLFSKQMMQLLHNFVHVGNKITIVLQITTEQPKIFERLLKIITSMSVNSLDLAVNHYFDSKKISMLEWQFIFRFIITGSKHSLNNHLISLQGDLSKPYAQDAKFL